MVSSSPVRIHTGQAFRQREERVLNPPLGSLGPNRPVRPEAVARTNEEPLGQPPSPIGKPCDRGRPGRRDRIRRGEQWRCHRGEAPNVRVTERKLGSRNDAGTDTDQHQAEIARAVAEPRSHVGGRAKLAGAIGFVTLPDNRGSRPATSRRRVRPGNGRRRPTLGWCRHAWSPRRGRSSRRHRREPHRP